LIVYRKIRYDQSLGRLSAKPRRALLESKWQKSSYGVDGGRPISGWGGEVNLGPKEGKQGRLLFAAPGIELLSEFATNQVSSMLYRGSICSFLVDLLVGS
jgi:hypothetical protein